MYTIYKWIQSFYHVCVIVVCPVCIYNYNVARYNKKKPQTLTTTKEKNKEEILSRKPKTKSCEEGKSQAGTGEEH